MRVSLLEFVRTGNLGTLRLGSAKGDVLVALGDPEDIHDGDATIWKYGNIEIMFSADRVMSIEVTFRHDPQAVWQTVEYYDFSKFMNLDVAAFETLMQEHGIACNVHSPFRSRKRSADTTLLLARRGRATFEEFRLASLSVLDLESVANSR